MVPLTYSGNATSTNSELVLKSQLEWQPRVRIGLNWHEVLPDIISETIVTPVYQKNKKTKQNKSG